MEKRELQRKITATCVITAIFCVMLGISVYLLLMSELFTPTIQWLMIACCGILAISVIGFVWNKVLEIRALRIVIRDNISTQSNNSLATSTNSVEPMHNTLTDSNSIDIEQNDFFSEQDLFEDSAVASSFESFNDNSALEPENNYFADNMNADIEQSPITNDNNYIDTQISYSDFQKADESNSTVNSPVASYNEEKLLQKSVTHDDLINESIYKAQNLNNNLELNTWDTPTNEQFVNPQMQQPVAQQQPMQQPVTQQQPMQQPVAQQQSMQQPVTQQQPMQQPVAQQQPMQQPVTQQQPMQQPQRVVSAPVQAPPITPVQKAPAQTAQPVTPPVPKQKSAPAPINWAEIKRQNDNAEKDRQNKIALEKAKANEAAFKLAAEREKHAMELAQREKEKLDLMRKQQEQLLSNGQKAQDKISQEQYAQMRKEEHEKAQLRHRQEQERLAKEHAMKQAAEQQAKIAFEKAQNAQEAAKRSDEIAKRLSVLAGLSDDS